MEKNNRVYGVIGIKSIMANWNADFSGRPKTISDGSIYASDKALKYPMKRMWDAQKKKVLFLKTFRIEESSNTLQVLTAEERLNDLFKDKEQLKLIEKLFACIDVQNFGATYAVKKKKPHKASKEDVQENEDKDGAIAITGAVQISQGFNKYSATNVEIQDILSPFPSDGSKRQASIGKKIVSDEAHYFYGFSVNPTNYDDYTKIDGRIFYSEEAYSSFKEAAVKSATFYNTNSKFGCENEFALFIELKDDKKLFLPELSQYIEFTKEDDKNVINLKRMSFLNDLADDIEKIEMFYNPITTQVVEDFLIADKTKKNIITGKDI